MLKSSSQSLHPPRHPLTRHAGLDQPHGSEDATLHVLAGGRDDDGAIEAEEVRRLRRIRRPRPVGGAALLHLIISHGGRHCSGQLRHVSDNNNNNNLDNEAYATYATFLLL